MATHPFTAFSFAVEIVRADAGAPLAGAAFAECDGLEIGMEVKTIREGGNNDRQIRLAGPATVGQLTLKRGMTGDSFELWQWMSDSLADPALQPPPPEGGAARVPRRGLLGGGDPSSLRWPSLPR